MGEVIQWAPPTLPFAHVMCSRCRGEAFHVETEDDPSGIPRWKWLHCADCGNQIAVSMTPVFAPGEGE